MAMLRQNATAFRHLDAAQLIKHVFGLATEAARVGKQPVLIHLYAEPVSFEARRIPAHGIAAHRDEAARFGDAVAGASVRFVATTWRA